eukprot:1057570-Pelagomonas_calceolata.AAC.4
MPPPTGLLGGATSAREPSPACCRWYSSYRRRLEPSPYVWVKVRVEGSPTDEHAHRVESELSPLYRPRGSLPQTCHAIRDAAVQTTCAQAPYGSQWQAVSPPSVGSH